MIYDLIIIGGGPAGLSAAIYAARQKINFIVLTVDIGGQTNWSTEVENYLGFHLMTGEDLVNKFREHVRDYKIELHENEPAVSIAKKNKSFVVMTPKSKYEAKAVIIATGKKPRNLNVPGEKELYGRGVTYCATCDAPLYKGKTAVIVGGGNSAIEAAMLLEKYCRKIFIVNIGKKMGGEPILLDKLKKIKNLTLINNARTTRILGNSKVTGLEYAQDSKEKVLKADGVFIEVGLIPNTDFCRGFLRLNKIGEIVVSKACATSVPGVFASGDVNDTPEKQIIVAAGEGCVALLEAVKYLQKLK